MTRIATRRISGSVIKNAAVDFRLSVARKLERLRLDWAAATLFGWNATSTMMHLPHSNEIRGTGYERSKFLLEHDRSGTASHLFRIMLRSRQVGGSRDAAIDSTCWWYGSG